MINTKAKVAFW